MAISWIIQSTQRVARRKVIRALLRDGTIVKQGEINIARDASPTVNDAQTAWETGVILPGGVDEWDALQLRETDALYDAVIRAMLNQLRDGGGVGAGNTLPLITNAGKAALAANQAQTDALTRLTAIFKAATGAQQADFLMLMVLVTNSKLGKR